MAQLSQTRTVLEVTTDGGLAYAYSEGDDDEGTRYYDLVFPLDLYEEMGSPGVITLTIQPGDKLNEEG